MKQHIRRILVGFAVFAIFLLPGVVVGTAFGLEWMLIPYLAGALLFLFWVVGEILLDDR